MFSLLTRVLLTLAYTDQFEYPLTAEEVWMRLIGPSASLSAVKKNLHELVGLKLANFQTKHYCLAGRRSIIKTRQQRWTASLDKQQPAKYAGKLLRWLPWIEAIYITGSLAVNNSPAAGDIDFMIVTKPDRLWLTRPIIILLSLLLGKKRARHRETPNSWCFNLWMTTDSLQLVPNQRNIFTAYEVCQAKCIVDRNGIAYRFLLENHWVARYLPNYYLAKLNQLPDPPPTTAQLSSLNWWKSLTAPLIQTAGDCVDYGLFQLQQTYMKPHHTRELVNWQKAFFHPRDTRKIVMTNWQKSLS